MTPELEAVMRVCRNYAPSPESDVEPMAREILDALAGHDRQLRADTLRQAERTLRLLYGHSDTAAYLLATWACYYENDDGTPPDFDRAAALAAPVDTPAHETGKHRFADKHGGDFCAIPIGPHALCARPEADPVHDLAAPAAPVTPLVDWAIPDLTQKEADDFMQAIEGDS